MDFCNVFQRVFAKTVFFIVASICLFSVDSSWSREFFAKKSLVVYFDNLDNTRIVAENIQQKLDADIVRLETVVKYPKDRVLVAEQMKSELEAKNYFPALRNGKINLSPYDMIVVGTPVWYGRAAPAVISFLLKNNFSGKKVYFFSAYSGNAGLAIDEMRNACKGATFVSFRKVELRTPLNNDVFPRHVIETWTAEMMAKK